MKAFESHPVRHAVLRQTTIEPADLYRCPPDAAVLSSFSCLVSAILGARYARFNLRLEFRKNDSLTLVPIRQQYGSLAECVPETDWTALYALRAAGP